MPATKTDGEDGGVKRSPDAGAREGEGRRQKRRNWRRRKKRRRKKRRRRQKKVRNREIDLRKE